MSFLDRAEKKFGKFYIENLTNKLVLLQAVIFIYCLMEPNFYMNLFSYRVVTNSRFLSNFLSLILLPPSTEMLWGIFGLWIMHMAGNGLEAVWGQWKFNVFIGVFVVSSLIASSITGSPQIPDMLYQVLFIAFALYYPDIELLIFFILPVKMKYLAMIDMVLLLNAFLSYGGNGKIMVFGGVLNLFVFCGPALVDSIKNRKRKAEFQAKVQIAKDKPFHICHECAVTEKTDPNEEFRFCAECADSVEYCRKHIKNHAHN